MRYRLRTLLALGPPMVAVAWLNRFPIAVSVVVLVPTCIFAVVSVFVSAALCWLVDIPITIAE
jgi:hypothetical protein